MSGITGSNWTVSGTNIYRSSGNVGIGTASPSAKLHVAGNIIASDPTADNHVATKKYVDDQSGGLPSVGTPGGYLRMTNSGPIWDSPLTWAGSYRSTYDCAQIGGTAYNTGSTGTICRISSANVPAGWTQAGSWQRYSVAVWGGDSCGNHKSSGPTTWSNVTSYYSYGSGTGQLACGCSATYADIWCSIGQYGLKYTVSTITNSSSNRLEVGVY